jgi:hypothetical protein
MVGVFFHGRCEELRTPVAEGGCLQPLPIVTTRRHGGDGRIARLVWIPVVSLREFAKHQQY